ncbi:MAG: hypothetical protein JEY96_13095 [Bacteroidales bacterium]|nr:hypothetical protein [Bacteroidales bacterium]
MPPIKNYAEAKNEFLILFKDFLDKVVKNSTVKFLREENLCDDKDIVYILQSIYQSSFDDGPSEIFIGYLSNYFHKEGIHFDTSKYF